MSGNRPAPSQAIQSMTGFSSLDGSVAGQSIRMEAKTLNHRFLDIKLRVPREWSAIEIPLRALIQSELGRGAVEFKIEKTANEVEQPSQIQPNLGLAANYYEALVSVQKTLGLSDPIRTADIMGFPDIISQNTSSLPTEQAWEAIEPLARQAILRLKEMRHHEGRMLTEKLLSELAILEKATTFLKKRRGECQAEYTKRIQDKIKAIFDAYPLTGTAAQGAQGLLETRIAQELAMLLDRTDIEEELTRFQGHLDHFRKILVTGGAVGRKLDFILQELGREINTLGNKAQDFSMSEEVVQVKVRLEQLREQVMNLE